MADITTPDIKAPVNATEAIYYTSEAKEVATKYATKEAIKHRAERAAHLRQIKEEKKDPGKAQIEAAREKLRPARTLTQADKDDMVYTFGAGRVSLEVDSSGNRTDKTNLDSLDAVQRGLVESSFTEGKKAIEQISDFLEYTEILNEAVRRGDKDVSGVLKDRKIERVDYNTMRKNALTVLVRNEAIQSILPELSGLDEKDQFYLLEELLAKDTRLRQIILEKIQSIKREMKSFKGIDGEREVQEAESVIKDADTLINEKVDNIVARLQSNNLNIQNEDGLKTIIKDQINKGASVEAIMGSLRRNFLKDIPAEQLQLMGQLDYARASLADLQKQQLIVLTKGNANQGTINQWKEIIDNQTAFVTSLETQASNYSDFNDNRKKVEDIYGATEAKQQDGLYDNASASDLKDAVDARKARDKSKKINAEKKEEGDKLNKSTMADRLQEESDVIHRLENVLAESVLDLTEERYDEMVEAQNLALQQAETDAEKNGDTEKKNAYRRLKERMKQDEIMKTNERTRKRYRDQAAMARRVKDAKYLLYHGEADEGVRKLIMRDMEIKKPDGTVYNQWEIDQLDLETLDEKQKALVEEAYGKFGEEYKRRIFTEFFMSRGIIDKLGIGNLSLKDHEWALMQQYYGEFIDSSINASDPAKKYLAELKEKNITLDSRRRLVLFLLGLLGLAGVTVAASTVSPAPVAQAFIPMVTG